MTIRGLSFDFDGCLFNLDYIGSEEKDVIKSNAAFLDPIKKGNTPFEHTYTFIGSNRQSFAVDMNNAWVGGKGSCFPAAKTVSDYLGTTLDKFLLADIYGDLPAGISFDRATQQNYTDKHSDWLFDDTKVTILYAQLHKMANDNPKEDIVFDFYDDRGNGERSSNDILEQLRDFYTKYPELIPAQVTLRLNHYAGGVVTPVAVINGKGFIDSNYRQTVKDMAAQAVNTFENGITRPIFVAEHVDVNLLTNRKARPTDAPAEEVHSTLLGTKEHGMIQVEEFEEIKVAKEKFAVALNIIEAKAQGLQEMAVTLDDKDDRYFNAAQAASLLNTTLRDASESYFKGGDREAFKRIADKAIKTARHSELQHHQEWKKVLAYTSLAVLAVLSVASVGLGYVGFGLACAVAGGLDYAANRQLFFSSTIHTDSMNKVDDLGDAIKATSPQPAP